MTQRGNARQTIFESDSDRQIYLDLLHVNSQRNRLSLIGYCLMSNHVHLIVVPRQPAALALTLKETHGRFATYFNVGRTASGHVWQGRYFSCPLDPAHLWTALRYTELNPVRARMATAADDWQWSSARAHCRNETDRLLDMTTWNARWDAAAWPGFLNIETTDVELAAIRTSTHTGRPLGDETFIHELEMQLHRQLAPQKGGRPQKERTDERQAAFSFEAE